MSFLQRFYSAFPGGTMNQTPGGGVISEAGGILDISVALAADGDWANNVAPIAWVATHDKHFAFDTVFKHESRMYDFTASGGEARAGIALYKDQDNGYEFGFYEGDDKIYVTRWYGGSGGNVANTAGAVAVPSTSPHAYRIYWNPTSRPLFVQEDEGTSFFITANSVQFWYRIGDAGTWTLLHTRNWEWGDVDAHFACCAHNYVATKRSVQALFSYAEVDQWDAASQLYVPANKQVPIPDEAVDPTDMLALEDQTTPLTQSGPAGYQWPDGLGDGAFIRSLAALEDQSQILPLSGTPLHSMPDGLDGGLAIRPPALALEDQVAVLLSGEAEFSTITQDADLNFHFIYPKPYLALFYDSTNEPWNSPTLNSFTGYGRDGYKYTSGVQDAGPVSAPWRSEALGVNRGSRSDFPVKSLIVVTRLELVIFDLDSYVGTAASLGMWMRFRLGNDSSTYLALGRGLESIRSVLMKNGQLVVGTTNSSWGVGRIHSFDFKATTTAATFSLIGSDGQWIGNGSKTLVDRNTTGCYASSGSYRIDPEENHSLSAYLEGTNTLWVAVSGEDPSPHVVKYVGNVIQSIYTAEGPDIEEYNLGNFRHVLFDENGWLWFAIGSQIYRNALDWREGYIYPDKKDKRQGQVDIGYTITHLVQVKDDLYAGTEKGVFRIPKGNMAGFYLAYTAVDGGGGGQLNAPPAGELLPGGNSAVEDLHSHQFYYGGQVLGYLSIATMFTGAATGGVTLIRFFDDVVVKSIVSPDLIEPGAFFAVMAVV